MPSPEHVRIKASDMGLAPSVRATRTVATRVMAKASAAGAGEGAYPSAWLPGLAPVPIANAPAIADPAPITAVRTEAASPAEGHYPAGWLPELRVQAGAVVGLS
ncbi:hypothetical protein [Miltoncostaea marina]|uniref:hypothetical protein n=1 Tax=Miltoncostaea marina TaxID=2843215 RepID=UPI001C3D9A7E|nr:hypothetical protein [Miltoncostaea marina]